MPAGQLRAWIDGAREQLRWIDFADYAARVFAAGNERWLADPNVYTGGITQAQGVVGTEVLSIDIVAPYLALLDPDPDAPGSAVQSMFEQEEPAAFVAGAVDALAHGLGGTLDLVLKLPSPGDVLRAAGLDDEPGFDDLDDVAIAEAGLLRKLSERPVSGILISVSAGLSDDEAEALESVVSAARHYGWCVAVSYDQADEPASEPPPLDCDLVLYPACSRAALEGLEAVGGGLDEAFWSGGDAHGIEGRALAYGVIPADAVPETVVACAAALKAG